MSFLITFILIKTLSDQVAFLKFLAFYIFFPFLYRKKSDALGLFTDLSIHYARGYTRDVVFLLRSFGFVACFAQVEIPAPSPMVLVRYWLAFLNQFGGFPAAPFYIYNPRFNSNSNLG